MWLKNLSLFCIVWTFYACSALPQSAVTNASNDNEAAKFFEEHLRLTKQKECNDKGLFYENGENECHFARLVTWTCSRTEVEKRIADSIYAPSALQDFANLIDLGLKFDQCGEDSKGNIYVMMIRKEVKDGKAEAAWKLIEIPNIKAENKVPLEPKKTEQELADEFFEETLKISKQKECNAKGLFYVNGADTCHSAPLATWACTLDQVIAKAGADTDSLSRINELAGKGLKTDQCGEDSNKNIYVMFVRKEIIDGIAHVAWELLELKVEATSAALKPTHLGSWSTDCSNENNYKAIVTFSEFEVTQESVVYSEDCTRELYKDKTVFSYTLSSFQPSDVDDVVWIDLNTLKTSTTTVVDAEELTSFNDEKNCGKADWSLNEEVDTSSCIISFTKYQALKVAGDKLYVAQTTEDLDGSTVEKRPTEFDETSFLTKKVTP